MKTRFLTLLLSFCLVLDLFGQGALTVNSSTGAITAPVSASTFKTGNSIQSTLTLGTGVQTALGVNIGSAGAPVLFNGAGGTPSSITLTNGTGLLISGLTSSTSTALGVGSLELGAASDTTLTRTGAGAIAVEGTAVLLSGGALGTPSSGTATNLSGTADSLTAGSVTRNHAVYAAASPPTVDVGMFTVVKTGVDLKTAGTTTAFTVPASRTYVCLEAHAIVTSVTSGGAGTETFQIKESGANGAMTQGTASASGTPAVGIYYTESSPANTGPYTACAAGNNVTIVVSTSQAGSTAVTGSVFVTGFYTQ
jgi:hypothetical protein